MSLMPEDAGEQPADDAVRQDLLHSARDSGLAWRTDLRRNPALIDGAASVDEVVCLFEVGAQFARLSALPPKRRGSQSRRWAASLRMRNAASAAEWRERLANVLEDWPNGSPKLPGFRELLWVAEQLEAAGALFTSYHALQSLLALVGPQDLRAGYARAQSGRILRTIGLVREAQSAFDVANEIADLHGDSWLRSRAQLGIGVLLKKRGRYADARVAFQSVLDCSESVPELSAAAHLGLVMVARASEEFDSALAHGWEAYRLSARNSFGQAEALAVLATLSLEVGEFVAARRSCQSALAMNPSFPLRQPLVRSVVEAAIALGDDDVLSAYVDELCSNTRNSINPWEQAHALRVLSMVYVRRGDRRRATAALRECVNIAKTHHYAEVDYTVSVALNELEDGVFPVARTESVKRSAQISSSGDRVIRQISSLSVV